MNRDNIKKVLILCVDSICDDCCIACVYHETPVEEMPCKTCTGERRYLYRPPQSWQYVEEVEQTI